MDQKNWLQANLRSLAEAATRGYQESDGQRGCVVVNTRSVPVPGRGNPIYYLTIAQLLEAGVPDSSRELGMIRTYLPGAEIVVTIINVDGSTSTYRLTIVPSAQRRHTVGLQTREYAS